MKGWKPTLTGLLAAASLAIGSGAAQAAEIQLGFIVDESGSISGSEFNIIRTGLANAINTLIPVGGADVYRISVVKFDNDAEVVVNNVLVNSVATRTTVAGLVAGMVQENGSTNYQAAFNLMQATMAPTIVDALFSYVNFATDGQPNEPGTDAQAQAAAIAARNALITAGIDNLSVEGIGVSGAGATFLQTQICAPQPCDTTVPFNFPTQGFYIGVANATEYAVAIQNKIRVVTGQDVPEPATLFLLGVGLLGLGVVRRRA